MKIFKRQPTEIKIIEDASTPSLQQTLLLDQKRQVIEMVHAANQHLDNKIIQLLQAAAVSISLVGILAVPGFIMQKIETMDKWLVAFSFASFCVLLVFVVSAIWPRPFVLPGHQDWEKMWYLYQVKDPDECYRQVLYDYANSINKLTEANDRKAKLLIAVTVMLLIQIGCLVATAIW